LKNQPPFCMPFFTYILYSEKLDKYYIGSTANIEERLKKHNHIHKGYTAIGQPWVRKYTEIYDTKSKAQLREKQLKAWKSRERLKVLIQKGDSSIDSEHPD